jgi:pimeloyl-ACP methyl ester carboxylesterase
MNELEKLLDDPSFGRNIFFPQKTKKPENDQLDKQISLDLVISEKIHIGGFLFVKGKEFPTILFFHGNGETAEDYVYFRALFLRMDVNFAVVDYRGYGFSSGTPTYYNLVQDSLPIYNSFIRFLQKNKFKMNIFIHGRSLGSVCAAEIGKENPPEVAGIIFDSGIGDTFQTFARLFQIDIRNLTAVLKVPEENLISWSNHKKIEKISKPTLVIHGGRDNILPFDQGEIIYNSIPDKIPKKLIKIEKAGHNDIFMYKDEYFNPLSEFISQYASK